MDKWVLNTGLLFFEFVLPIDDGGSSVYQVALVTIRGYRLWFCLLMVF